MQKLKYLLTIFFLLFNTNLALSEKLDLDNDNISDFIISNHIDNKNYYTANFSSNNQNYLLENISKNVNLTSGNYIGSSQAELLEFSITQKNQVSWNITPLNNEKSKKLIFGTTKDILLTGCSFLNQQNINISFIRNKTLYVKDLVNSKVLKYKLKLPALKRIEQIICSDLNNDNIDEIYVLYKKGNRKIVKEVLKNNFKLRRKSISQITSFNKNYLSLITNRKKRSKIITFNLNKEKIHTISTPKVSLIYSAKRYNSINKIEKTFIFISNNNLFQYDFESKKIAPLLINTINTELIIPNNSYIFSSESTKTNLCTETYSANDGLNGFLWKESDHGGLVVLLPSSLTRFKFSKVSIYKDNKKIEDLKFASIANGYRQHWRSNNNSWNFPDYSYVVAEYNEHRLCWKIGISGVRND